MNVDYAMKIVRITIEGNSNTFSCANKLFIVMTTSWEFMFLLAVKEGGINK